MVDPIPALTEKEMIEGVADHRLSIRLDEEAAKAILRMCDMAVNQNPKVDMYRSARKQLIAELLNNQTVGRPVSLPSSV